MYVYHLFYFRDFLFYSYFHTGFQGLHAKGATIACSLHFNPDHHIIRDINQANIPNLWLKGAALSRTVYPLPYLRSMGGKVPGIYGPSADSQ